MSSLSKEHLLSCLTNPKNYKDTKVYLAEVQKQNEKAIKILSQVLTDVIAKNIQTPLTKLCGLRLFKDIFETAEFNCIEQLDEKIENAIYRTAAYKKQSKEQTRGEMYFIEVEKKPDTSENRQLGKSYHLFALEIMKNFADWYPKDFEGEVSRFKEYYDELVKEGVTFHDTSNYIKPQDKEKFRKNFKKWMQKLNEDGDASPKNEPVIPQPKVPTTKQPPKQQSSSIKNPPQKAPQPQKNSVVKDSSPRGQPGPPSTLSDYPSKIPETSSLKPKQPEPPRAKSPKQQYDQKLKQQLETSTANFEKLRADFEAENTKIKKTFEQKETQYNSKIDQLKKELDETKQKLTEKDRQGQQQNKQQNQAQEDRSKKLEAQISQVKDQLVKKQKTNHTLEQKIRQLEDVIRKKDRQLVQKQKERQRDDKPSSRASAGQVQKINALKKQVDKLERTNEELTAFKRRYQDLQKQKCLADVQMKDLQRGNQQLKNKYIDLEKKLQQQLTQKPLKLPEPPQKSNRNFSPQMVQAKNVKKLPRNENNASTDHKRIRSMPKTQCQAPNQGGRKRSQQKREKNLFDRTAPNFNNIDYGEADRLFSTSTKLSELLQHKIPAYRRRKD